MAKSKKKNGYSLYMEFIRSSGITSGQDVPRTFDQLAVFCSDGWQALSPEEKQKFNDQAKQYNKRISAEKASANNQTNAYDNVLERQNLIDTNRQIVDEMIKKNPNWSAEPIVICTFSLYVDPPSCFYHFWQPAEIGLTAMNLKHGVLDNFARIIDPSPVPKGYGIEAVARAETLGLPAIGRVPELEKHKELALTVKNFIEKYTNDQLKKEDGTLYVFAFPSDIQMVTGCLEWLFEKGGIRQPVKVLSLSVYGHLASADIIIKKTGGKKVSCADEFAVTRKPLVGNFIYTSVYPECRYGMFLCEESVEAACKDVDNYKYFDEQCCIYHMKSGMQSYKCALNVSNRYAFSILEILTLRSDVVIIPGGHYPEIDHPAVEKARRYQMLKQWGITKMEEQMEELKPGREQYFSRAISRARRDSGVHPTNHVEQPGRVMRAKPEIRGRREELGGGGNLVETVAKEDEQTVTTKRNRPIYRYYGRPEGQVEDRETGEGHHGEAPKTPRLSTLSNGGDDGKAQRNKENRAPEEGATRRGVRIHIPPTPYTRNTPGFYGSRV